MLELTGKYGNAKVFANVIENEAISQIIGVLNTPMAKDSQIRIMPDVHAGAGCTIGTTMTIEDKICPNLVGVDISCGMLTVKLKEKKIDFELLDKVIRENVPSGAAVHKYSKQSKTSVNLEKDLKCFKEANIKETYAYCSVGTLGGGWA